MVLLSYYCGKCIPHAADEESIDKSEIFLMAEDVLDLTVEAI